VTPMRGLLYTSGTIEELEEHAAVLQADLVKLVPLWGTSWDEASRRRAVRIGRAAWLRSVDGDPSYGRGPLFPDGVMTFPVWKRVVASIKPFWDVRDPAKPFYIEIGNEWLLRALPGQPVATEQFAWDYVFFLGEAIAKCREAFPGCIIVAPAHIPSSWPNEPIPLGGRPDGQRRALEIAAEVYRRCDALAIHAYGEVQLREELKLIREVVSPTLPVWVTEFALPEQLSPADRGRRYAELLRSAPIAGALFYHLDAEGGTDPNHFRPEYQLDIATLRAVAANWKAPPPPSPVPPAQPAPKPAAPAIIIPRQLPDTEHFPQLQVPDFALDVRQWRTVAAFRRHLSNYAYRATAPWAKGLVVHHTYRPLPSQWLGADSILALAKFYRYDVDNGIGRPKGGWTSGPHLFIVRGSPNPAHDGIWQLTPLNLPGTHARAANGSRWGLEHVADATRTPMPAPIAELGQGAAAALLDWGALPVTTTTVSPHAVWGKPACPGRATDMDAYRRGVQALMETRS
jgi:hypothetical protein